MGRLEPLTSMALGRSPYDDVVEGEGPENPRGHQQMYDDRGRPINPETKRINKDIIRSHNEVMMVIGVAEPENGIIEAQAESARRHHRYEDRIGRRLMLIGGILETTAIWGVNGMRQRILLYKEYSQQTFHGIFQLVWKQQSLSSYLFGGLPSFMASTFLEQLANLQARKYPVVQYATTYIRLHLAIYTFFQRTGIVLLRSPLPNWRFFIPGTSISPIPLPPLPTSFGPRSLRQWLGAFAIGVAPFAGFYLYTKLYSFITRTLRFEIYRLLPRPFNAIRRRPFRELTPPLQPGTDVPVELRTEEILDSQSTPATNDHALRRQSTASQRASGQGQQPDDFASDEEDTDMVSATLISFDVEASEPMPDPSTTTNTTTSHDDHNLNNTNGPAAIWAAELRPNLGPDSTNTNTNNAEAPSSSSSPDHQPRASNNQPDRPAPVYRETVLTRLPAVLATDVLAITPARLFMTPFAAAVWLRLARRYVERQNALGVVGVGLGVMHGVVTTPGLGGEVGLVGLEGGGGGFWAGFMGGIGTTGLVNLLGLELLLAVLHGEMWAGLMMAAERYRVSEEEWKEREGVGEDGDGMGEGDN